MRLINRIVLTSAILGFQANPVTFGEEVGGSRWIAERHGATTVVFVHGVLGNATDSWTNNSTRAYWPNLMAEDCSFNRANIFVYEYPTNSVQGGLTVDEVAVNMHERLKALRVLDSASIIFLSHSMGGLVTRAFLLKYREVIPTVAFLYFYGTPTEGSPMAVLSSLASRNPQFKNMIPLKADSFLAPLQSNWIAAHLEIASYCAYETRDTYGMRIVDLKSASNLCTSSLVPINENHIDLVKPRSKESDSYVAFKNAYQDWRRMGAVIQASAAPIVDHPIVDLSRPVAQQIRLYPEDKVKIYGPPNLVGNVQFGTGWQPYKEGYEYMVAGTSGQAVSFEFNLAARNDPLRLRRQITLKLEVTYSKYRTQPRDLSAARDIDDCTYKPIGK
ncbi:alpha/beta hydrolase [Caballeronia sp. GACF5]|uniref:esterase/lipase family protein n=1 Tax=Caballeronia sp. GACF5 TaxID=2921746 RepID=UPI002028CCA8